MDDILSNRCQDKAKETGLLTHLLIEQDISKGSKRCIGDLQLTIEKVWKVDDEERVVAAVGRNSLYSFLARRKPHVREQVHPDVTTGRAVKTLIH